MNSNTMTGKRLAFYFLFALLLVNIHACRKTESYPTPSLEDYYPLQSGKYITYQLDSLKYLAFGTRDTTVSYQVKYYTDAAMTDNLGRPAWRIFRYIRKDDTQPWATDATFMAVPTSDHLEFIENNLRFIALHLPIENNYAWKGNSYIDTYSANSELKYLDNWDYTYANTGQADQVGGQNFSDVLFVNQRDEVIGDPTDPSGYSEINFGQEKYAKGLGLIYKKFFHQEFQPGNGGYVADGSYGITLTVIDHN